MIDNKTEILLEAHAVLSKEWNKLFGEAKEETDLDEKANKLAKLDGLMIARKLILNLTK